MKAKAEAEALTMVAEALKDAAGADAAQLQIAKQYIDMYGEMGKSSNTMLFSDRPADVNALIAQVCTYESYVCVSLAMRCKIGGKAAP